MLTCSNCRHEIPEGVDRCSACGTEVRRGLWSRLFGGGRSAPRPSPAPPIETSAPVETSAPLTGVLVMKVQDVFSIKGRGTVVTGSAAAAIKVGDAVAFQTPSGAAKVAKVTGIEMLRKLMDQADPGDQVGLLLKGVGKEDVAPGTELRRA